jgi:hypothetical protein
VDVAPVGATVLVAGPVRSLPSTVVGSFSQMREAPAAPPCPLLFVWVEIAVVLAELEGSESSCLFEGCGANSGLLGSVSAPVRIPGTGCPPDPPSAGALNQRKPGKHRATKQPSKR